MTARQKAIEYSPHFLPISAGETMSKHKMEIYNASSGVVLTLSWDSEAEFLQEKAFLKRLVGGRVGQSELGPGELEFNYLENDEQRDALYEFRRGLKSREL